MKDQHKQSDSLTTSRRNPTSRKALPRLTLRIDFDAGRYWAGQDQADGIDR
jgi:hypothetical protein